MRVLGVLSYLAAGAVFIFLVLLPTIFTWIALYDSVVGGILFSILLMPIAIIAYPIIILAAGLATGVGGTASVLAALLGYAMMGVSAGLFFLGAWLYEKGEEKEYARQRQINYTPTPQIPEGNYLGNNKTTIFHSLDCPQASQIDYENFVWFESPGEAIAQGFKPCKNCHPEL